MRSTKSTFDSLINVAELKAYGCYSRLIFARPTRRCQARFDDTVTPHNATMRVREIHEHCQLDAAGEQMLEQVMTHFRLSARAHDRIRKVARTIADLGARRGFRWHIWRRRFSTAHWIGRHRRNFKRSFYKSLLWKPPPGTQQAAKLLFQT